MSPARLKILVTVVTRNRVKQLATALDLITRQTLAPDEVLVVDNASEPATRELVQQWQARHPKIVYQNTGSNSGSAGGQKWAMAYAVKQGFDLVYTMDDDCEPQPEALEKIVQAWRGRPNPEHWALNSMVLDLVTERMSFGLWVAAEKIPCQPSSCYTTLAEIPPQLRPDDIFPNWGCFFNGTLIPVKMIEQVGLPREEFFIRGEEVEYLFRILRRFRVGTALQSIVRHPSEAPGQAKLPAWKTYYQVRNNTLNHKTYFPSLKTSVGYLHLKALKHQLLARFKPDDPAQHAVAALAVRDAIQEKFDRDAFALK